MNTKTSAISTSAAISAAMVGFGAALPQKCVSNDDLPADLDTSDEWISRRTGIKQRYIADESKGETTASLATAAAREAMEDAGVSPEDVDLIIVATTTGDYTFPATATIVQRDLGIKQGVAFDISAACSGFVYGLDIVDSFMKCGKSKCAILIGSETFSKVVDWHDRSTCVLFGDGAGAVVIRAVDAASSHAPSHASSHAPSHASLHSPSPSSDFGVRYCRIHSDGTFVDQLKTSGGISTTRTVGMAEMDGREVFRFAVEKFSESLRQLLADNNLSIDDVDIIVPHQANSRIIDKLREDSGIAPEKMVVTVSKHANTSAASIPLALHEVREKLRGKRNVVLLSMGAGFTWGAALMGVPDKNQNQAQKTCNCIEN